MISGKTVGTGHLVGVVKISGNTSGHAQLIGVVKTNGIISGHINRYIGGDSDPYTGEYIITPKPYDDQILETRGKLMVNDVTVLQIPYYETSNVSGLTVYIGGE